MPLVYKNFFKGIVYSRKNEAKYVITSQHPNHHLYIQFFSFVQNIQHKNADINTINFASKLSFKQVFLAVHIYYYFYVVNS